MSTCVHVAYDRLSEPLRTAGVPLYVRTAPHEIRSSGLVYVVLLQAERGWESDAWHSVSHPRLVVNIYADAERGEAGEVLSSNAPERAQAVYGLVNPLLHNRTRRDWPEIVSCRRESEPWLIAVPDDDHAYLLSSRYEVAL